MDYWKQKNELIEKAKIHYQDMKNRYQNEIDTRIVKFYASYDEVPQINKPKFTLIDLNTVEAIFYFDNCTALDFASYKDPGGLFFQGSSAQEESLCHASYLYNVLEKQKSYYAYNRNHKNAGLYENRLLYCKDIFFQLRNKQKYCDIIVCAAPNRINLLKYNSFNEAQNNHALKERIKLIKFAAEDNNVKTLILGAFGCGVFKQKPHIVCSNFIDVFQTTSVQNIVFAIPKGPNYKVFKEVLTEHNIL